MTKTGLKNMIANLEKILKNAEENLRHDTSTALEDHLNLFKKFLNIEDNRLKIDHRNGTDGFTICKSRAYLIDVIIKHIYQFANQEYTGKGYTVPKDGCAIVAIGGYGRNELNPHSDLDLIFLYEKKMNDYIKYMIEKSLYMLWDIGLSVGHGVRSVPDAVKLAKTDPKICSATFESRFIIGSKEPFTDLKNSLTNLLLKNEKVVNSFIDIKIKEREDRHYRFGASMYVQEPNIKECIGGLRDIQNICWLSTLKYNNPELSHIKDAGMISGKELATLQKGYDFLLRVRNELHYTSEKKFDILTLIYQKKIAYNLGYQDKHGHLAPELFMKDYYTYARNIAFLTQNIISKFAGADKKEPAKKGREKPEEIINGILLIDKEIHPTDKTGSEIEKDPLLILDIFLAAQTRDAVLSSEIKGLIRNNLIHVEKHFRNSQGAAELFLKVFEYPGKIGRILRQMNEIGFLGKFIPEFGKIVCLVQDNFYHKYTADEHTLVAIDTIDQLFYKTDKYRDIFDHLNDHRVLYLALLFHDIGKLDPDGHVEESCSQAQKALKRFPVTGDEIEAILFLIRNHLTLMHIAQRRDLDDEKLFKDLAKRFKDIDLLNMLLLLSYADSRAVSPGVWTEWKESLVWELYIKTKLQITGKLTLIPEPKKVEEIKNSIMRIAGTNADESRIDRHLEQMPKKYMFYSPPENIIQHITLVEKLTGEESAKVAVSKIIPDPPTAAEITVCTYDRLGIFSIIAGCLTLNNINILSAQINTRKDNIVLDTFRTTDETGDPLINDGTINKFKETLIMAVDGRVDLAAMIDEHQKKLKARPLSPQNRQKAAFSKPVVPVVTIDNSVSDSKTVIEIQAPDKLGLLFNMSNAIASQNVNISFAKIHTEKNTAFDVFYITDMGGNKIFDDDKLNTIRTALLEKLDIPNL
ncbi:[protein-PII] uridylyltransferase [Candidatus Auribacterota bacterium]